MMAAAQLPLPEPAARRAARSAYDMRCGHALDRRPEARCQLWAGHHSEHAVMFARTGTRLVRCWRTSDPATTWDMPGDYESLPWLRGYPQPAWTE